MEPKKSRSGAAAAGALLTVALLLVMTLVTPAAVGATTQVKITPVSQTILAGNTLVVNVMVTDVTDMGADQATVQFDPQKMSVSAVSEGAFLKAAGSTVGAGMEIIDNTQGDITFFYSLTTYGANVDGSGTLATIYFNTNASARDSSTLDLNNVLLATGTGGPISATINDGSVNFIPFIVTLASPVDKTYASTAVKVNFSVQPASTVLSWRAYSLDGGANIYMPGTTATISGLTAGTHQITLYARDPGGYTGTSNTVSFKVHPADCNGDKTVNVLDLQQMAWAFNAQPQSPNWNGATDLNIDNIINIYDVQIFAWNFGNTYS